MTKLKKWISNLKVAAKSRKGQMTLTKQALHGMITKHLLQRLYN